MVASKLYAPILLSYLFTKAHFLYPKPAAYASLVVSIYNVIKE